VRAATRLEFAPSARGQAAGLVLGQNEDNHYLLRVVGDPARRAELVTRVKGASTVIGSQPLEPGPVVLQVEAFPERYEFAVRSGSGAMRALGSAPTQPLSTEKAGGFTGVYLGMYASGPQPMPPADFAWFEYEPLD
jgi:alpha-N-arabinofuranosidase